MDSDQGSISVILPSRNEAEALVGLLPRIRAVLPQAEIVVVNDGSRDQTVQICEELGVRMLIHPYTLGNGAAVKTGARAATGDILIFMDADGQHPPEAIPKLLDKLAQKFDMVVGARSFVSQAGVHRGIANSLYNRFASWMVGHRIEDLTSGFRAVRAGKFRKFLHLLPNGFSYPTTITMSFFRLGYSVGYVPMEAHRRIGKSHIRLLRDGARFFLIIFRIAALYSPLRIFAPVSAVFFLCGVGHYAYSFLTVHRFTNMSALLFIAAVLTFLIGLISEQIAMLSYRDSE